MKIGYKPSFIKQYSGLEPSLREEAKEKIEAFKNKANYKQLKVHKLKGELSDFYSFSVNYRYRIIFTYLSPKEVVLLAIGDHEIYK